MLGLPLPSAEALGYFQNVRSADEEGARVYAHKTFCVKASLKRQLTATPTLIILETERLALRHLSADDAAFILELLNDPSFIRYIGDKDVRNADEARAYIANGPIASYNAHGFGLYLVELKTGRTPIGICGLLKRDTLPHADIGFAFLPAFWSQGYAFESAAAVMAHARDVLGLDQILAITAPDNEPSAKLLVKIGLRFERMTKLTEDAAEVKLFTTEVRE